MKNLGKILKEMLHLLSHRVIKSSLTSAMILEDGEKDSYWHFPKNGKLPKKLTANGINPKKNSP